MSSDGQRAHPPSTPIADVSEKQVACPNCYTRSTVPPQSALGSNVRVSMVYRIIAVQNAGNILLLRHPPVYKRGLEHS